MTSSQYDVVIVGAGCAGLTAAIGLARNGFTVAVVEAAAFPGAANWSGCVYNTQFLADPSILGLEGVEQLAWERRLVQRGAFITDGRQLLGLTYRDDISFRHHYLVLRPVFDHSLALAAVPLGITLLCGTTVESLLRSEDRVVGVATQRGPLYADLVFLAEGDASHLAAREGYERSQDPRDAPRFLHAIKQVIELPPGAIEDRFGVGAEQGVAYDFLLRNGTVDGRVVPLNMTGFLCTNRQSLSLGLMLPAEHLRYFAGSSPALLAWLRSLPILQPWLADGRPGPLGAKLIRAGGSALPYLADAGLAIGGAASGIGARLPALDFIGPATMSGLLLARAAASIRDEGGGFTREQLERHYLGPLSRSACFRDAAFQQRWPGYVRRSRALFDLSADLALQAADIGTSRHWLPLKLLLWCRLLGRPGWEGWTTLQEDLAGLRRALHFRDVVVGPGLHWILFRSLFNALGDFLRKPRLDLPEGGEIRLHYRSADRPISGRPPWIMRRWFRRTRPILEAFARLLYAPEPRTLADRLRGVTELLARQLNLFTVLAGFLIGVLMILGSTGLAVFRIALAQLFRWPTRQPELSTPCQENIPQLPPPPVPTETWTAPSIHLLWPREIPDVGQLWEQRLERICPTQVFELQPAAEVVRVRVHPQRCIGCETCWRVSSLVDWGRDTHHPVLYRVTTPVLTRLLRAQERTAFLRPAPPRRTDPWQGSPRLDSGRLAVGLRGRLALTLDQLEHKLAELDRALERGPSQVDRGRLEHLEMLARFALSLAQELLALLPKAEAEGSSPLHSLARLLVRQAEKRLQRTWEGRLAWAAADGRRMRQYHLAGLRHMLGVPTPDTVRSFPTPSATPAAALTWKALQAIQSQLPSLSAIRAAATGCIIAAIAARRLVLVALAAVRPGEELERDFQLQVFQALTAQVIRNALSCTEELQELAGPDCPDEVAQLRHLLGQGIPAGDSHPGPLTRLGHRLLGDRQQVFLLLDRAATHGGVARHRTLQAELQEIEQARERLALVAQELAGEQMTEAGAADREVAERLGWEAGTLLASKLLLSWIEQRLEQGGDTELETVLLRVWLDERAVSLASFLSFVHLQQQGLPWSDDRPLVEPQLTSPAANLAELLAAPATPFRGGDFLLAPIDLHGQPLVPEMMAQPFIELPSVLQQAGEESKPVEAATLLQVLSELEQLETELQDGHRPWWPGHAQQTSYLAWSTVTGLFGAVLRAAPDPLPLELACTTVLLRELRLENARLTDRPVPISERPLPPSSVLAQLTILEALSASIFPRIYHRAMPPRHLGHEALALERLKNAWRQAVRGAADVTQPLRWQNPSVQASCLALSAATAWLWASECVLQRLAWLERVSTDEEDTSTRRLAGLLVLARCYATVQAALKRFQEDLASLRRGYSAPQLRVPFLLAVPSPCKVADLPMTVDRPLTLLILLEPQQAILPDPEGEQIVENHWALAASDQAALETALRIRDAAPAWVRLQVAVAGPRRARTLLREIEALTVEEVRWLDTDSQAQAAQPFEVSLASLLDDRAAVDLLLAGERPVPQDRTLALDLAELLQLIPAGPASTVAIQSRQAILSGLDGSNARERSLPTAVFIQPGLVLRDWSLNGYLKGLSYAPAQGVG